jgi:hypothetical protein
MKSRISKKLAAIVGSIAVASGVAIATRADATGTPSSLIPITPCRLADTRPGADNVGARNGALGASETATFAVRGTNGNCTIPGTATGISANVTAVSPTSSSYVTIWPSDVSRPNASNLNFAAGTPALPNAVTVALSSTGAISAFNLAGSVHLIIDIVGYYDPATAGPTGPAGTAGANGAAGANGTGSVAGPTQGRRMLVSTLVDGGLVGQNPAATSGVDGFPVVTYFDAGSSAIKLVKCNDVACASSSTRSVAADSSLGDRGIAIGSNGLPVFTYYDSLFDDLILARCNDSTCTAPTYTPIDTTDDSGLESALAIAPDGTPAMAYINSTSQLLRYAKCDDAACTTITRATIASAGESAQDPDITFGPDGFPRIAYFNSIAGRVSVARCTNVLCSVVGTATPDTGLGNGQDPSIAIGPDGLPVIAYFRYTGSALAFAKCTNTECSTANLSTLDTVGDVGRYPTVAIGSDGYARIAYSDLTNQDLKLVECRDSDCTVGAARIVTVASSGNVGEHPSITALSDGSMFISYYSFAASSLYGARVSYAGWSTNAWGN